MIEVVGGIIQRDDKLVLVKNRQGFWVFPGGKIDEGESKAEALIREISEELDGLEISLGQLTEYKVFDGLVSPIGENIVIYTYKVDGIISGELKTSNEVQGIGNFNFSESLVLDDMGDATKKMVTDVLFGPAVIRALEDKILRMQKTRLAFIQKIKEGNPGIEKKS